MSRKRGYILILPSLFTTGNLLCGFYSLVCTFHQDFDNAAVAILLAGLFDLMDGRVARVTSSESQFGIEYDSIADVVSFGLAPSFLAYVWGLEGMGGIGFAVAFLFAACGALRLARFNAMASNSSKAYFVGLPIPAAANAVAGAVLADHTVIIRHSDWFFAAYLPVLGLLMVSEIRYRSFKEVASRKSQRFLMIVGFMLLATFLLIKPHMAPFFVFGGSPSGELSGRAFEKSSEARHPPEPDEIQKEDFVVAKCPDTP